MEKEGAGVVRHVLRPDGHTGLTGVPGYSPGSDLLKPVVPVHGPEREQVPEGVIVQGRVGLDGQQPRPEKVFQHKVEDC